jgi:antitoxin component YwqK of YwqJK toxin-antitoxin module
LLCLSLTNPVAACRCDISLSVIENIEKVSYVALVRVKNILSIGSQDFHKIVVEELVLYKGHSTSEILVSGGNKMADPNYYTSCDLGMELNDQWVIFGIESEGKIETFACAHTFRYKDKNGYRDFMGGYQIKMLNELNKYFDKPMIDYSIYNKGVLKLYYLNGKEECEIRYKQGVKQGESKYYFPDGTVNGTEYYNRGKLDGVQKNYTHDGNLSTIKHFSNGIEIDTSNYYRYNLDSGRNYLWFTEFHDKNGLFLHLKSYTILDKFLPFECRYVLEHEIIYDTVTKLRSYIEYYPSGMQKIFYKTNNDHEIVGDEISYSEEGFVTRILRVKKGEKNKIIYIDTKYWPNYDVGK